MEPDASPVLFHSHYSCCLCGMDMEHLLRSGAPLHAPTHPAIYSCHAPLSDGHGTTSDQNLHYRHLWMGGRHRTSIQSERRSCSRSHYSCAPVGWTPDILSAVRTPLHVHPPSRPHGCAPVDGRGPLSGQERPLRLLYSYLVAHLGRFGHLSDRRHSSSLVDGRGHPCGQNAIAYRRSRLHFSWVPSITSQGALRSTCSWLVAARLYLVRQDCLNGRNNLHALKLNFIDLFCYKAFHGLCIPYPSYYFHIHGQEADET
ncbi:hypothetical protein AVEN_193694-1 [Araneus ventricosus]|uniref:Uncharacterized protein n=1 Tax=Araneus ventricosus TaxID=182803 RepID=A0A4Y2TLX2_ARAVE|nr:hypothetical protein AVEN_193694-1 [Araneus ventricosus]